MLFILGILMATATTTKFAKCSPGTREEIVVKDPPSSEASSTASSDSSDGEKEVGLDDFDFLKTIGRII
jgi:hypothetical protein